MNSVPNPFNITKAVDFSDQEINDFWVDLSNQDGFASMVNPTSAMPMLILGGKGSGKTHLMRHFSYPLQRIRHSDNVIDGIRSDGYLGIYFRCGGLNSSRFSGEEQTEKAWADVFAYYMELWLAQLVLNTVIDLCGSSEELREKEEALCADIATLFDEVDPLDSLASVRNHLNDLQRSLDLAINNCAVTGSLNAKITVTRGKLIFGLPRIFSKHLAVLENLLYVYLVDEFENLTEPQQKYVNTLIREKEIPCSFKVGAKLFGVRTYSTYSADEDNKEGSEFDKLWLDLRLRQRAEPDYRTFAKKLIARRLLDCKSLSTTNSSLESIVQSLDAFFENPSSSDLSREETSYILDKYNDRERPYFRSLRKNLERGIKSSVAPGVSTPSHIEEVIETLRYPEIPLLEKANIFLLYKDWYTQKDLLQAAKEIEADCCDFHKQQKSNGRYSDNLNHFKADLLAQLSRDCDQKQRYRGIDTLVDMSWGLPRNLLILLKYIYYWAVFYEEQPFIQGNVISMRAQDAGVAEAADWFFRDARIAGPNGKKVQDAIHRLGTLFRDIRFSDKPAECSCSAFSCDVSRLTEKSREVLDLAEKWSLLIDVGDQYDRNSNRVDFKYQINRMLAPRWGIAINRRGVLALSPDEVNAVFDPDYVGQFDEVLKKRIDRMTAPFFGRKKPSSSGVSKGNLLPGFDDD